MQVAKLEFIAVLKDHFQRFGAEVSANQIIPRKAVVYDVEAAVASTDIRTEHLLETNLWEASLIVGDYVRIDKIFSAF